MRTVGGVTHVGRRPATEEELESALRRILSVHGIYDGDEIARILRGPAYGFEIKGDGQFTCLALLTKIFRENPHLELGLVAERGRTKLTILNHKAT